MAVKGFLLTDSVQVKVPQMSIKQVQNWDFTGD